MIEVIPYESVGGAPFGCSEAEVVVRLGEPTERRRNPWGELEFHYESLIVRFAKGAMAECTLLPNCTANVLGHQISWNHDFLSVLVREDPNLVECAGFVTSLKFGISTVGLHQDDKVAIHVFRRGAMDVLLTKVRPFRIPENPPH